MSDKQSDIRVRVRAALKAGHPLGAIAKALNVAEATVLNLALPDEISRCRAGSIALAEKHASALAALVESGDR